MFLGLAVYLALTTVIWTSTSPSFNQADSNCVSVICNQKNLVMFSPSSVYKQFWGNQILKEFRGPRQFKNPFSMLSSRLFAISCPCLFFFLVFGFFVQRSALLTQGMLNQGLLLQRESSGRGFFLEGKAVGTVMSPLLSIRRGAGIAWEASLQTLVSGIYGWIWTPALPKTDYIDFQNLFTFSAL